MKTTRDYLIKKINKYLYENDMNYKDVGFDKPIERQSIYMLQTFLEDIADEQAAKDYDDYLREESEKSD